MKKPTIHVYGICYNEEVLMPHFLKHYSKFCEKIFIYDNFSNDKSIEICSQFSCVSVLRFDTGNKIRDDIYLKLKNDIWKKSRGEADLVIVCDIDEFLYSPNLIESISNSYYKKFTLFKCHGFNMVTGQLPTSSNQLFSDFQFGVKETNFDKILMFDPNKIEEINYGFGAHDACPIGDIKYADSNFALLHYKFLDLDYLQNRYKMFSERLSEYNKKLNLGYHYTFSKYRIQSEYNKIRKNAFNVIDFLR